MTDDERRQVIAMVERFMLASMEGRREVTDVLMAPDIDVTFTGGRKFKDPSEVKGFNAGRYAHVRKKIERWDVAEAGEETVVYSLGTLHGAWPDGTPFEGNRYVDRFVIRGGRIVKMDVWNDSAELMLLRA
ncbi:MAG: nuclear transport factor 2 family protein [Geminicoccaceae bacterium]